MLTILSWNIRQGGGTRINPIVKAIANSNCVVAILSEFRNNEAGIRIRDKLLRNGFRFQGVTAAKPHDNSVLLASKIPGDFVMHPHADINLSLIHI